MEFTKMRTRVCALILEEDKVLLVAHYYPRGILWHLPGGKIRSQEQNLEETLKRELWEELKLKITVDRLAIVCKEKLNTTNEVLQLVFFAQRISIDSPIVNFRQATGKEAKFMPIRDLDKLTLYPNIGREIMSVANMQSEETIYLDISSPREWL